MPHHSPLEERHIALGAKLVPFGGWDMPLSYPTGTVTEHLACRNDAVAFDVSHLGTVRLSGGDAFGLLQRTFTNDLNKIGPGRAQYTHLLDDDASVTDDIIVWWREDGIFDVMPNASNTDGVRKAIGGEDVTASRAIIAVQGPSTRELVKAVLPEAADVPRFAVRVLQWNGTEVVVAGTGYTGEDGIECAVPAGVAGTFWDALIDAGITPAGLGARDTLRLEAGLPLHGHELGPGISPLHARLGWVVAWNKDSFVGKDALTKIREVGPDRHLIGVIGEGRRPLREGCVVNVAGNEVGTLTSGNFSPVLQRGIGLALVATDVESGTTVDVDVRGSAVPVTVSLPPFIKKRSS